MAYALQFQLSDTFDPSGLGPSATTGTLTNGNFGSPSGVQLYVVDYGTPGTAEIISATISGTSVTGITRGLTGGAAGTTNHAGGATIGSIFVPQHYSNGLGAIAANDAWTSYTPTYNASGSMTWTSITTNSAHYILIGKSLLLQVSATGTVGGTPSDGLIFSLPSGMTHKAATTKSGGGCGVIDNGSRRGGHWYNADTNQIQCDRYDSGNFTVGSGGINFTGVIEIA